jgi:SAM-dependent methyltransferase
MSNDRRRHPPVCTCLFAGPRLESVTIAVQTMIPHTEHDSQTFDLEALARLDNYYGWILDEIRPYLGNRLAEIGAGIGTFTKLLASAHLARNPATRLEVFEPAGHLCRRLRSDLEQTHASLVQAGRLLVTEGYFEPSSRQYDTIIMINVLEHIQDDQESVCTAYQALSPGGTFVVYSPALQWLFSSHDEAVGHYRRYDMRALEQILVKTGFTVVAAKYMDCMGVLPWYLLNVIGGSTSINPRLAHIYDRWFVPITRWIERLWRPWIGKNVLIVARKNVP